MSSSEKKKSGRKTNAMLQEEIAELHALVMEKENDLLAFREHLSEIKKDLRGVEDLKANFEEREMQLEQVIAQEKEKDELLKKLEVDLDNLRSSPDQVALEEVCPKSPLLPMK